MSTRGLNSYVLQETKVMDWCFLLVTKPTHWGRGYGSSIIRAYYNKVCDYTILFILAGVLSRMHLQSQIKKNGGFLGLATDNELNVRHTTFNATRKM